MTQVDAHNAILADQRMRDWFVQEKILKEAHRRDAEAHQVPERSVVTISRQYGAGGHTFAGLLAGMLETPWQVWDREIVDAIAENANVRQEMVEALDERSHSLIEKISRTISKIHPLTHEEYRNHLIVVLTSISQQGKKIIIGRGANFVLPQALNIRLIASTPYRIRAVEVREGLSHMEAAAKVRKVDSERAAYIARLFDRDIDDPLEYDIVLRMDDISFETAAAGIVGAICRHQAETRGNLF